MRQMYPDELELDIPGGEAALVELPTGVRDESKRRVVDLIFAIIVTFVPPLSFALALWLHFTGWYRISAVEISIMCGMWFLAVTGIEVGYHRLFAHNTYKASKGLRSVLAILGSFAFQGPVIWWAAVHRRHHRHSDRPGDPHSMYYFPDGSPIPATVWGRIRGFIHAHIGWIWTPDSIRSPGWARYVRDLYRDEAIFSINLYYFIWLSVGFLIPTVVGGLIHGTWKGAFLGFLWGGFVRIFFSNHLTYWSINSLSHSVGQRHYVTADRSSNSLELLMGIPTLGQSYHNNHHAFPMSSKMSQRWYEIDVGHAVLWIFERAGWVTDRRYPSKQQMMIKAQDSARQFKQGEVNE